MAEQYQVIEDAFAAEGVPLANAHITVNRFCHITDSKEEALRFAENARYQSRLASSLRRRQEVMQGTVLVDKPFPDEPPLEQIHNDLLIGDSRSSLIISRYPCTVTPAAYSIIGSTPSGRWQPGPDPGSQSTN